AAGRCRRRLGKQRRGKQGVLVLFVPETWHKEHHSRLIQPKESRPFDFTPLIPPLIFRGCAHEIGCRRRHALPWRQPVRGRAGQVAKPLLRLWPPGLGRQPRSRPPPPGLGRAGRAGSDGQQPKRSSNESASLSWTLVRSSMKIVASLKI